MRKIKRSSLVSGFWEVWKRPCCSFCPVLQEAPTQSETEGCKSWPGHLWVKGGGRFMRWEIVAGDSVDWRIPNLHASVLHPEVGSLSHADEKPRLHHTWGRHRDAACSSCSCFLHHHHQHHRSSSPGIILMAVLTSFQFWAFSNFQSRMKLLLSVTTGPWEQKRHDSDTRPNHWQGPFTLI